MHAYIHTNKLGVSESHPLTYTTSGNSALICATTTAGSVAVANMNCVEAEQAAYIG
jgi:hypothetical protein